MTTGRINQVTTDFGTRGSPRASQARTRMAGILSEPCVRHFIISLGKPPSQPAVRFPRRYRQSAPTSEQKHLVPRSHKFQTRSPCPGDRDHCLRWRLPATGSLLERGAQSRRIPEWLYAQRFWPRASNPHPSALQTHVTQGRHPTQQAFRPDSIPTGLAARLVRSPKSVHPATGSSKLQGPSGSINNSVWDKPVISTLAPRGIPQRGDHLLGFLSAIDSLVCINSCLFPFSGSLARPSPIAISTDL